MEFCETCRVPLPKAAEGSQQSSLEGAQPDIVPEEDETSRYGDIKEAVEKMQSGEWTLEEYEYFMQDLMQLLMSFEQEIRDVEIPEESYDEFNNELETGFTGVNLYNEGLATLMLYVDDQNPVHLENGLQLVWEGNEKINEAIRINRLHRAGMGVELEEA